MSLARAAWLDAVATTSASEAPDEAAVPICPDHQASMRPSKFGGYFCPRMTGDKHCQHKVKAPER
jgi:hypothetical protein